jgi:hypothetical protein
MAARSLRPVSIVKEISETASARSTSSALEEFCQRNDWHESDRSDLYDIDLASRNQLVKLGPANAG